MGISNKYSGWYGSYKGDKKPTEPYSVVKIKNDMGEPISGMEKVRIEAYSPVQARFLFLEQYSRLKDYLEMGFQIEVELDEEMLKQRQQIEEVERQDEEQFVQDAWWNQ